MLHARNCTSKTPIVIVHNHTKTIVKKTNPSNYNPSILARVHELLILVICILKVNCQILWPSIFPLHSKHSFSFNNTDIHVSGSCDRSKSIMRLWCRYKQSMQAMTKNSKSSFIGLRESFISIVMNVYKQTGTSDCASGVCSSDLPFICWKPYNFVWLLTRRNTV